MRNDGSPDIKNGKSSDSDETLLEKGVIVAKRHIHATTKDAEELGVKNGEIVNVKVETDGRTLIFGDVVVRVNPNFAAAMHIDTDEANGLGIGKDMGILIK